jgi:dipeptidyl aminopeptidase/acylaminoacyl peptidase
MDGRREFTPAAFKGVYYEENNIDVQPYLVQSFETVEFPARDDGNTISGWFIPSITPSDKVVIVVHGADVCRRNTSVLLPSGMLAHNGFNVLSIDLRNHGDSEVVSKRFTAGVTEYKDVLGAFDWLRAQGYAAEHIGMLGVSMGASTSINAFAEEPAIAALWADSAFADIPTVLDDQLTLNKMPLFFAKAVLTVARLIGTNMDMDAISPIRSIEKLNGRPAMIVHGSQDEWVNVNSAYRLHDAAGKYAELWIIDGARHVEGMFLHPADYEERLVTFFENALGK